MLTPTFKKLSNQRAYSEFQSIYQRMCKLLRSWNSVMEIMGFDKGKDPKRIDQDYKDYKPLIYFYILSEP